jgi:quinol-cytochrome oxidoreductase complex cytochrome b subunit/coenzyme F420-reducing hydrogenase delta subunit
MRWLEHVRQLGLKGWRVAQAGFDAAFGSALNPLRHLGAIATLAFALLVASGSVLYVVLDSSVEGAHRSIQALSELPLGLGDLLRGLHRYAADLLVVTMALHLLREWLHAHDAGVHRFAWWTGAALIGLVFTAAIGGFWLNWDQLGQFSAIATAEWIDALPLLAAPLARNFLGAAMVGDRLFSLFIFVHIGVPLLLAFGLWFHLQRLSRPEVLPPRALALGTLAMLAVLSLAVPVRSHAPALLSAVPESLRLDWMLLFVHPLVDATSPAFIWAAVALLAAVLFAMPFVSRSRRRAAVAQVTAAHCNGCQRCLADCPYAAISMLPHPNQRIGRTLAVVDADLCAGCGICAGACPSSTPFRGGAELATGIDMPQRPVGALRERLRAALGASARVATPLVLFRCEHGARGPGQADDVHEVPLLCAGQLPPSFVEYALRDGAAGVVVAACREGGCAFRLGERWTSERLAGRREPRLRGRVLATRLELVFADAGDEPRLAAAIQRLRERIAAPSARAALSHV